MPVPLASFGGSDSRTKDMKFKLIDLISEAKFASSMTALRTLAAKQGLRL
jgi:hypothetical protein